MTSPAQPTVPGNRLGFRGALRDPRVQAGLLYSALTLAAAVAAYWAMFSQFAAYDDEGTLLVALDAFVRGHDLYREIDTSYGPFYYGLFGSLFAITGKPVSTDASRLLVVAMWTSASLLVGVSVQRLTGRLVLGATGVVVAFSLLQLVKAEPMHPVGLALVLLTALVLVVAAWPNHHHVPWGAAGGGLLAAVTLTKINLGLFALAAAAFAAVTTVEALRSRAWLRWPVTLAFLAMPLLLMRADAGQGWVREYGLLVIASAAAVLVAAGAGHPPRKDSGLERRLVAALVGLVGTAAAIVAAVVATGPSVGDLYESVVVEAQTQAAVFTIPLRLPYAGAYWGIAALAAAIIVTRVRGVHATSSPWPALLRLAAGISIWLSPAWFSALGLDSQPPAALQLALPLALTWVAALPPTAGEEPPGRRFVRVLLPALAIAETLQAYPVAGTQVSAATLMFIPVGALCLGDGWSALARWMAIRPALEGRRAAIALGAIAIALIAQFAHVKILRPGKADALAYRNQRSLPFSGASLLRPPPDQFKVFTRLVTLIQQNRCTTLAGLPSMNSFHLWSSVQAPEPLPPVWMKQFSEGHQRQVVAEMRQSARPCAIRNHRLAAFWMRGRAVPHTPLVRYITDQPSQRVGPYQFVLLQSAVKH